ncbi:MAG: sugar phosphate isomerase/epimerase family protein [Erysipelotrichaceae bacterium]
MKISIISDQINNDFTIAFPIIKQQGYKYVELHNAFGKSIEELNQEELNQIKESLKENQLEVSNIATTIFFLAPLFENYQVSLFSDEFKCIKGNVEKHLEYLENACHIAKELNSKTIRVFPFRFPDNVQKIFGTASDIEQIVKYLKQAETIAKKHDITLVVENCPYSHCPKGKMTYTIIKQLNSNNIKLLWDPANSYRAEKHQVPTEYLDLTLNEELSLIHEEIGHIHLKNYNYDHNEQKPFVHQPLLYGDINFNQLINNLKKFNYQGFISLEPEVDFENTILSLQQLKEII